MDIKQSVEDSAEALLTRVKAGENVSAARQYLDGYIFARMWRLVLKMTNCEPKDHDLLIEYKCEMRGLLLLAQEMRIDLNDAEAASKKFKNLYQGVKR